MIATIIAIVLALGGGGYWLYLAKFSKNIVGVWVLDASKGMGADRIKGEAREIAEAMLNAGLFQMTFTSNGRMEASIFGQKMQGDYTVEDAGGDRLRVTITDDLSGRPDTDMVHIQGNSMWMDRDGSTMYMKRK